MNSRLPPCEDGTLRAAVPGGRSENRFPQTVEIHDSGINLMLYYGSKKYVEELDEPVGRVPPENAAEIQMTLIEYYPHSRRSRSSKL